jgi:signal transduction histidine kinase
MNGATLDLAKIMAAPQFSNSIQLMISLGLISLLPFFLISVTSFLRIIIVFSLLRTAIGTQQVPPNSVLIGLALFMTVFIMSPVWQEVNTNALVPYNAGKISQAKAIEVGCHRKGLAFSVQIDEAVPTMIEVDSRKVVQVLVNLLGNALKFTERGSLGVRVAPFSGGRRGDLLFQVADTGIGIPVDRQQHIFESFVQAEGHLTRPSEGTGLGLTIARKLVVLLGGELWLESAPGQGSTFSFTIELGLGADTDRR